MKLGFHPPLTRLYIFIKNEANCLWYWLDDGKKQYISESALTGLVKRFEVKESQTSHGTGLKADFEIVADRRYVLRSGIDSAFSKKMLLIISALTDEQLKRPITLELKPGDEKGNVLVSARDPETFEPIRTAPWESADWEGLLNQALSRLGDVPQPAPAPTPAPKPQRTPQPQPAPTPQPDTISQRQYEDLKTRAYSNGYTKEGFAELLAKYGFQRGSEVKAANYRQLWGEACDRNQALLMNSRAELVPQ